MLSVSQAGLPVLCSGSVLSPLLAHLTVPPYNPTQEELRNAVVLILANKQNLPLSFVGARGGKDGPKTPW